MNPRLFPPLLRVTASLVCLLLLCHPHVGAEPVEILGDPLAADVVEEGKPAGPGQVTRPGEGYRGIWFTLGQFSEHGDKYSGGLGTYTANHVPLAVYAPEVDRTFFVYGGTTRADERHLLIGTRFGGP